MEEKKEVKRTERGWAGHFICADSCKFRRNTLLEYKDSKIIVSTVGNMCIGNKIMNIGCFRYYETFAFRALFDGTYYDVDVSKQLNFESNWALESYGFELDLEANDMHEKVVDEITQKMLNGKL